MCTVRDLGHAILLLNRMAGSTADVDQKEMQSEIDIPHSIKKLKSGGIWAVSTYCSFSRTSSRHRPSAVAEMT